MDNTTNHTPPNAHGPAFYSTMVAKKQGKDLYDRAARMFRKEPGWRTVKAALLSAMDAHALASALTSTSNTQERAYCEHALHSATRTVEDAEKAFQTTTAK
jgi:hypothetical protein